MHFLAFKGKRKVTGTAREGTFVSCCRQYQGNPRITFITERMEEKVYKRSVMDFSWSKRRLVEEEEKNGSLRRTLQKVYYFAFPARSYVHLKRLLRVLSSVCCEEGGGT